MQQSGLLEPTQENFGFQMTIWKCVTFGLPDVAAMVSEGGGFVVPFWDSNYEQMRRTTTLHPPRPVPEWWSLPYVRDQVAFG